MKKSGFISPLRRFSILTASFVAISSPQAFAQTQPFNGGNLFANPSATTALQASMRVQPSIVSGDSYTLQMNVNQGVFDADEFELNLPVNSVCADGNLTVHKKNVSYRNLRGFHLTSFRGTVECDDGTFVANAIGAGQNTEGMDSFKLEVPGIVKIDAYESGIADVQIYERASESVEPEPIAIEPGIDTIMMDDFSDVELVSPSLLTFGKSSPTNTFSSGSAGGFTQQPAMPQENLGGAVVNITQPTCDDSLIPKANMVDILFGFTSEAKRDACLAVAGCDNTATSSYRYILEDIEMAVERTNQAFCNSGINYRVRASGAVNLVSESSAAIGLLAGGARSATDISNFAMTVASRGKLAFLTNDTTGYRDRYQADLVSIVISNTTLSSPTDGLCGYAMSGPVSSGNKQVGVSVISRDCLAYHQLTKSVGLNLNVAPATYSDSITIAGVTGFNSAMSTQLPNKRIGCFAGVGAVCCDDRRGATGASAGQCVSAPIASPDQVVLANTNMPAAAAVNVYSGITRIVPSSPSNLPGRGYMCVFSEGFGLHKHCIQTAIGESSDGDIIQVQPAPNCFVNNGQNFGNYCFSGMADPNQSTNQPGDRYIEHLMMASKAISLIGVPGAPESVKISGNGTPFLAPYGSAVGTPAVAQPIHNYSTGEGDAIVLRTGGNFDQDHHVAFPYPHQVISGLTLTDGMGTSTAGGFWCIGGVDISFTDNIVEGNLGIEGRGAGLAIESCSGTIERNIIRGNKILGRTTRQLVNAALVTPTPAPPADPSYNFSMGAPFVSGFPGNDRPGDCWLRPNVGGTVSGDFIGMSAHWPVCYMDSTGYSDFLGPDHTTGTADDITYGYVGGAGIRVSTSRYWSDEYPHSDLSHAIVIRDNIIYKNEVPPNMIEFLSPTAASPTAAGAGIQLYGEPAIIVNNTIVANGPSAFTSSNKSAGQTVPMVYFWQNKASANTSAPMDGFGIGCIGDGPQKSFIHNNIIADNDINITDMSGGANVAYNFNCAGVTDYGQNVTDSGALIGNGGNMNQPLTNVVINSNYALNVTALRSDVITNLRPQSTSAAADIGLTNAADSRVPQFDYLNATWFYGPKCATTSVDAGALESVTGNSTCGGASGPTNPPQYSPPKTPNF